MKAFIRRALCAVGLTGGVVIVGFGLAQAASADTGSGPVTSGESGIVSGNQTGVDAQAPVNASGNQVTVIGQRNHTTSTGSSSTASPAATSGGSSGSPTTSGQNGIGSGNQTAVGAQAPINVSGNQVTVIGQDNTTHSSGSASTRGSGGSSGSPTTSGESGIGSGNQTGITVLAPINVSCNQVTVIGQDNTSQCAGGSSASAPTTGTPVTTGQNGIVAGNQTGLGVLLPINLSGNQVTVIGQDNTLQSTGTSGTGTPTTGGGAGSPTTSGESGIGSGNQTGITVLAPIAATGNQVTVIGQDNTVTSTGGSSTGGGNTSTGETTTGAGGAGSGNQTPVVVQAPVDSSGNQVTVIGQDNTTTSTSGSTSGGTTGGSTGGVVSPPTGGTVNPPTGGTATGVNAPQGGATPSTSVLPNTGLGGTLLWLAALGLLLLALGSALTRRAAAGAGTPAVVRAG
jgi:hypothetical protein